MRSPLRETEWLDEPHIAERAYTQAFLLCFGEPLFQIPHKVPFYYQPLSTFEDQMKKNRLIPPSPAQLGT